MTGHQYEQFVRAVLVRRLKLSSDKLRSARSPGIQFSGDKGPKHQIDLLCVDENEIAEYTTIIECKYRESGKVDQEDVEKLAYVKSSMRASKAILVTNHGFTDGAERIADTEKIALLVITPRIDLCDLEKAPSVDDLFHAIDAKLQEAPRGYDLGIKRKFAADPSDHGLDLVAALLSDPAVRSQVASLARDPGVQRAVKQIAIDNPDILRKAMDFFKK